MSPITDRYALYSVGEVEAYLMGHPNGFDFKRGHELLAGCVLAKCSMIGGEKNVGVGFRLASSQSVMSEERPTLQALLSDFTLDDRDVDIIIGSDEWQSPFQVARLEERGRGSTPFERLKEVLRKKTLMQPDPKLELVILIDETFDLKLDDIHDYLGRISVPYGRICLVAQTGPTPKLGQFQRIEIFPNVTESMIVKVRLARKQ